VVDRLLHLVPAMTTAAWRNIPADLSHDVGGCEERERGERDCGDVGPHRNGFLS